jgi:Flp pilus assembly protein TadD
LEKKRAIFYLMAANASEVANDFGQAIADCRSAIAIDPDSSKAWRSLGSALMDADQDEEAESALEKSIALLESRSAHIYLGCLHAKANRFDQAEWCFRSALKVDPAFDEAYYNLGCALAEQGRFDEAMTAFQSAIQLSPDYDIAHGQLGKLYLRDGNTIEASRHLHKCLEISPNDEVAIYLLKQLDGE